MCVIYIYIYVCVIYKLYIYNERFNQIEKISLVFLGPWDDRLNCHRLVWAWLAAW